MSGGVVFGERVFLDREVEAETDVSGLATLMSDAEGDNVHLDAGMEQAHRRDVAQNAPRDVPAAQ